MAFKDKFLVFKRDAEKIRRKLASPGVQNYEVAEFVNVVAEYARLLEENKKERLGYGELLAGQKEILKRFFSRFKDQIWEALQEEEGKKKGLALVNKVHFVLFGAPWNIKMEAEEEVKHKKAAPKQRAVAALIGNIVSAIRGYPIKRPKELDKHARKLPFFNAKLLARGIKKEVAAEVQIVLKQVKNKGILDGVLAQEKRSHVIRQAVSDLLRNISSSYKDKFSDTYVNEVSAEQFVEIVYPLVMAEIEAKEKLAPAKAAA